MLATAGVARSSSGVLGRQTGISSRLGAVPENDVDFSHDLHASFLLIKYKGRCAD